MSKKRKLAFSREDFSGSSFEDLFEVDLKNLMSLSKQPFYGESEYTYSENQVLVSQIRDIVAALIPEYGLKGFDSLGVSDDYEISRYHFGDYFFTIPFPALFSFSTNELFIKLTFWKLHRSYSKFDNPFHLAAYKCLEMFGIEWFSMKVKLNILSKSHEKFYNALRFQRLTSSQILNLYNDLKDEFKKCNLEFYDERKKLAISQYQIQKTFDDKKVKEWIIESYKTQNDIVQLKEIEQLESFLIESLFKSNNTYFDKLDIFESKKKKS